MPKKDNLLFASTCLFLIGFGAVQNCTFNGISYVNGHQWVENGAYVLQCTFDSDFRWDIRLVGCALSDGRRLPLGSVFYDSMGEWECLGRDCGTVIRRGIANTRGYRHSSPEEGQLCAFSAIRLLNESCGGCNAYKCMDSRKTNCGADGYLLGFAMPSCERLNEIRPLFDNVGQQFIECANKCLIGRIGRVLYSTESNDCEALKLFGLKSNSDCFVRCNFCGIWATKEKELTMAFHQQLGHYSTEAKDLLKVTVKECEKIKQTERTLFHEKINSLDGKAREETGETAGKETGQEAGEEAELEQEQWE